MKITIEYDSHQKREWTIREDVAKQVRNGKYCVLEFLDPLYGEVFRAKAVRWPYYEELRKKFLEHF
jgi:hypothetical protein